MGVCRENPTNNVHRFMPKQLLRRHFRFLYGFSADLVSLPFVFSADFDLLEALNGASIFSFLG